ncbi:hypothetical protein OK871_10480, partial [Streptococcus pneumoniae]|nr:hypothetical protein [Streptococcus pneumoniae]
DFGSLVDPSRRISFEAAKTFFSALDVEHFSRNLFKLLEIVSFIDWSMGAVFKQVEQANLAEDVLEKITGFLSCTDIAIHDAAG